MSDGLPTGRRRASGGLAAPDRAALGVWSASRLGILVLAWLAAWLFSTNHDPPIRWLDRWNRWDADIFVGIARDGYFGGGTDPTHVAFFPGFPMVLEAVHAVTRDWTAAGLLVSLAAGTVAAVALGRLAGLERVAVTPVSTGDAEAGAEAEPEDAVESSLAAESAAASMSLARPRLAIDDRLAAESASTSASRAKDSASRTKPEDAIDRPRSADSATASAAASNATLFFALAPAAVFLAAGYSESLFAAFAFPAWYAARRDRWLAAVVLSAGASFVRVNGLFLAAALALEFLLAGRARRSWRQLPLLVVPALPVLAYVLYLHRRTGDWLAWQHAQAAGWFRTFSNPRAAWNATWDAAFGGTQDGHTALVFQLELVAVVVGVALTLWLLARRRWPEALYVGLSLLALSTTTWFMSVPRAMLLWWPLWTALGAWAVRRPAVRTVYVCCVGPVMAGVAVLFLSGQWAG